ncbi:hypothetical protein GVAV_000970 [Gurleya vavrai]
MHYKGPENFFFLNFRLRLQELNDAKIEIKPLNSEHKIILNENSPAIISKQYRYNIKDKEIIEEQVNQMLMDKTIRNSNSSYCSPVVLIRKKRWLHKILCRLPTTK